jgi:hypothetical protein
MTTGLLEWGQAGNYNAANDRLAIRALAGPTFFGLVLVPTMAAGSGLAVSIGPWLAIVDCGDGTSAVIGNTASASINETAGGASQRTDVLWADINPDGTSQWSLSWLPSPVSGRTGVALGTAVVPASAATAAAMTFTPGSITPQPVTVGPWFTAANPGSPAGLVSDTRFRYRQVPALNAVQVDFSLHCTATGTWTFPAMDSTCWVSQPGAQPRIYTVMGNGQSPAAGSVLSRITLGASGALSASWASSAGGVATLNAMIPQD